MSQFWIRMKTVMTALLFVLLAVEFVQANIASNELITLMQPDGTSIELRRWGDEFSNGWETADGFTVVQESLSKFWCYAVLSELGSIVPLPDARVNAVLPPQGLEKHIRPPQKVIMDARALKGAPAVGVPYLAAPPSWKGASVRTVYIMVQFPSDPADPDGPQPAVPCTFTAANMRANLFGSTATGPGNLADYYREISYGAMELTGDVFGPFTVANDKNDYDDGPSSAEALVAEAVALADATVDFSPYDMDGDGSVDNVAIVYAGGGPDNGVYQGAVTPPDNLWPHAWHIASVSVDGGARTVSQYYIVPELRFAGRIRTIGVFAHEFGHKLGLPDLYDTDGSSQGVGHWSLMGSGSWCSNTPGSENGESPAHMDPWSKWFEGWITPVELTGQDIGGSMDEVETTPHVVQLLSNPNGPTDWPGSGEYFLIENRQLTRFDRGLDGCGILVWHIDESQTSNEHEGHTASNHRLVDLEAADGIMTNRGNAGDPFPGTSNNSTFNDATVPHSRLYNGTSTGIRMEVVSSSCVPNMLVNLGIPSADLSISKTDTPDPVLAGNELYYSLTIRNEGPAIASNVMVTDILPTGVTFVNSSITCLENPTRTLNCNLGTLLSQEVKHLDIKVAVSPSLVANAGSPIYINNSAQVSADQTDENLVNNSVSVSTLVEDQADIRVTKECKPDGPILSGQIATCTILVDNLGPSHARDVVVTDTHLSNGNFTITSATFTPPAASSCSISSGVVTCDLDTEPTGSRTTITVSITSSEQVDVNDTATVTSETPDPDTSNNLAQGSITFKAEADLSLTKYADLNPVTAGTDLTYTLRVQNNGPSTAKNVKIEDVLPAGVTIKSVTASGGGTCNAGVPGKALLPTTCTFDSLASLASRTMTVVVTVAPQTTGILGNNAKVLSETYDPDNSNNLATTATTVESKSDLRVQKSDYPDPVLAGNALTYDVVITNGGPSTAVGVNLTDSLPTGVTFQNYTISGGTGTCSLLPSPPGPINTLSCDLNNLNPAQFVRVIFTVLVNPSVPNGALLTNTATASSATSDPNTANNTATATTTVNTQADMADTKISQVVTTNPGPRVTYTITTINGGPSDAQNVVMVDYLPLDPKKVVFVFDTGNGACSYDKTNHRVTCNYGTQAAGTSRSVDIVVDVRGSVGVITNTATVTSTTFDPNTSNNTVTKDVRIKGGPGRK